MSHLQEFEFSTSHKHTNTIRIECTFIQSPLKLHIRHHLLHFTCSFFCLLSFSSSFFFINFYSYLLFRSLVIHHNNTQLSRSPAIRLYMSNMKNSFPSAVSHQIALLLFFASIERLVVYIFDTLSLTNGGSIWATVSMWISYVKVYARCMYLCRKCYALHKYIHMQRFRLTVYIWSSLSIEFTSAGKHLPCNIQPLFPCGRYGFSVFCIGWWACVCK